MERAAKYLSCLLSDVDAIGLVYRVVASIPLSPIPIQLTVSSELYKSDFYICTENMSGIRPTMARSIFDSRMKNSTSVTWVYDAIFHERDESNGADSDSSSIWSWHMPRACSPPAKSPKNITNAR
jgi:hypothetical protein